MTPILPPATLGIFGGGQLGRMIAMSARTMGYRVVVLDPDPECPAHHFADRVIEADWEDSRGAAMLAQASAVVTLEIEQISPESLASAATFVPLRPGAAMVGVIQDRIEQKQWLRRHGFPTGEFAAVRSFDELQEAVRRLGGRCFCKGARGGYDGRGQGRVGFTPEKAQEEELRGAWEALSQGPGVVERALDLECEISVMVARSARGEMKVYPAARNHHVNGILDWSVIPCGLPPEMEADARELAAEIAETFALEGLLAVEMFLTKAGDLLINELAPRPHNSYHESERACVTGQFEQAVRAACGLPLGGVELVQPAAIANLLGEVWFSPDGEPQGPAFDRALTVPGVRLHLYEKQKARRGRKMGHLSGVGITPAEAVERVLAGRVRLSELSR